MAPYNLLGEVFRSIGTNGPRMETEMRNLRGIRGFSYEQSHVLETFTFITIRLNFLLNHLLTVP